jgi:hypothetical protein
MYGSRQNACILFLLPLILFRIPNLKCPPPLRNKEEEEGEEESDAEEEPASGRTRSHRNSIVVVVVGATVSRIWDCF